MTLLEALVTGITLVVCGFGVYWLIKDLRNTIEKVSQAEAERCEGLVDDEDEE